MQGFNMGKYVPPEQEGVLSGNAVNKKHALGARASKISQGILTVRFELPFAIWCASCPQPTIIGQGVRFNAQKRKVGQYHSTPVLAFRFRHPACGGDIEVRTDPAAGDYVVAEGARRRAEHAQDRDESLVDVRAGVAAKMAAERERERASAFDALERTIEHRERLIGSRERVGELETRAARDWDDPYARNQRLRRAFRAGRHEREREAEKAEGLKEKMSLGIELLPESEGDARRAALVDFGPAEGETGVEKVLAQPLFGMVSKQEERRGGKGKMLKGEVLAAKTRANLASEVMVNTRMKTDPFLETFAKEPSKGNALLPGLKKKTGVKETASQAETTATPVAADQSTSVLVDYDSD
jgi:coiled-coil domain-containing protein 130